MTRILYMTRLPPETPTRNGFDPQPSLVELPKMPAVKGIDRTLGSLAARSMSHLENGGDVARCVAQAVKAAGGLSLCELSGILRGVMGLKDHRCTPRALTLDGKKIEDPSEKIFSFISNLYHEFITTSDRLGRSVELDLDSCARIICCTCAHDGKPVWSWNFTDHEPSEHKTITSGDEDVRLNPFVVFDKYGTTMLLLLTMTIKLFHSRCGPEILSGAFKRFISNEDEYDESCWDYIKKVLGSRHQDYKQALDKSSIMGRELTRLAIAVPNDCTADESTKRSGLYYANVNPVTVKLGEEIFKWDKSRSSLHSFFGQTFRDYIKHALFSWETDSSKPIYKEELASLEKMGFECINLDS